MIAIPTPLPGALRTTRPFYPAAVYNEVVPLAQEIPTVVIVPTQDRTMHVEWMLRVARETTDVEPTRIDAGHCPHVSRSIQTAAALNALAA
jgi:pimeloyl-ACP methyl ester carboxylesterase